jgi:hypothetical protein
MQQPNTKEDGIRFLVAKRNSNSSRVESTPLAAELDPLDFHNWIDFGERNEFQETMKHDKSFQSDGENSSIPVGSDVDLGAPLTDTEDFLGSQILDSEWVDDIGSLERMKELLGFVSEKTTEFLTRPPQPSSLLTDDDDDDDDDDGSIENGGLLHRLRSLDLANQSSRSELSVYTDPLQGEKRHKARKSKKTSKEVKKKKKKKKTTRSLDGLDSDSNDEEFPTYQALGDFNESGVHNAP